MSDETLTCGRCGLQWTRLRVRGRKPSHCTACIPPSRATRRASVVVTPAPVGPNLAGRLTDYRLAIELATGALRLGRPKDALEHLMAVQAPARQHDTKRNEGSRS